MTPPEKKLLTVTPVRGKVARPLVVDERVTLTNTLDDGYSGRYYNLIIIVSLAIEDDGECWMHASVSRQSRALPKHEDLKLLKELAFGPRRTAVQIFPPAHKYVDGSLNPIPVEVLHLWGQFDHYEWLPDMRNENGDI